ncbi:uncharacterized protein N7459_005744 [Penicillium hispanicum]|uniref:uncharacterized protein n=1 Tax=Penicillium hispanicum TaxID=1080232 RepID=UPI00254116A3|nr:uncharacterized protein N7459_005744 [Penicillium hispanicum]KAJ5579759.1 hypothetical protein N7459_005744 [Penicillium hispanicum]
MSSSNSSPRRVSSPPASPASNILLFLIGFRILNAFAVRTFFQPDEFFQSLEPAWQIAFGKGQGAWITWEWHHQLRSSIHPLLFAGIYKTADFLASVFRLPDATRAELLIAGPKTAQAVVSAIGDFYTWKLATGIYGEDSRGAWATLLATILNPWQWFCSTRTLSNCLETTLTVVALDQWPWQWSAGSSTGDNRRRNTSNAKRTDEDRRLLRRYDWHKTKALTRQLLMRVMHSLRQCLVLAAVACILRPTNVLVWATLASFAWLRTSWSQRKVLVREVLACGTTILAVSAVADRLFYGIWTFPPLRFLYFNIAQSLAVFYGRNDWHYYASQGYPLLLTTFLPPALVGLYRTLTTRTSTAADRVQTATRVQLATVCILMPFVLSLISHKEVRFIYPLLPSLHILAAPPLVQFFWPAFQSRSPHSYTPQRLTFLFVVLVNLVIALYTTLYHASGPANVLAYLRNQHEIHSPSTRKGTSSIHSSARQRQAGITAGFLMPCHSTPWRSHLVYPSIDAWALSCEPPIDLNETQKTIYRDEADQFYDDPNQYLREHMVGGLRYVPRRSTYIDGPRNIPASNATPAPLHEWPDYLIFFAQLEPTLNRLLRASFYDECYRTWNTHWHDDWRRRGDIVVWCLDTSEQDKWRAETRRQVQESRDRQFDRIVEAIRTQAHGPQKRGWKSLLPSSLPWSTPTSSASARWRRAVQSLFPSRSTRVWPWTTRSRSDAFWSKFRRQPPSAWGWVPALPKWSWPSLPSWMGGKPQKKTRFERDLWS